VLGLKPAPEFEAWLHSVGIFEPGDAPRLAAALPQPFRHLLTNLS
jgi:ethanolamine ammonia-lyase large subunit